MLSFLSSNCREVSSKSPTVGDIFWNDDASLLFFYEETFGKVEAIKPSPLFHRLNKNFEQLMCHASKRSQAFMWIATELMALNNVLISSCVMQFSWAACSFAEPMRSHYHADLNAWLIIAQYDYHSYHPILSRHRFWLLAHICQQLIYLPIPRYSQRRWGGKMRPPPHQQLFLRLNRNRKILCRLKLLWLVKINVNCFVIMKNTLHCGRSSSAKWQSKQKLHLSFKSAVSIFLDT